MSNVLAYAMLTKDGKLQKIYHTRPKPQRVQFFQSYWDEMWPKCAPHRIVELVAGKELTP